MREEGHIAPWAHTLDSFRHPPVGESIRSFDSLGFVSTFRICLNRQDAEDAKGIWLCFVSRKDTKGLK
jgi:hypothetical protein